MTAQKFILKSCETTDEVIKEAKRNNFPQI